MMKRGGTDQKEMLARLKRGKTTFEVLVHEGLIDDYRSGKLRQIDVVPIQNVFSDISKAEKASDQQLEVAFGTSVVEEVIDIILKEGDVQESESERKERMEAKHQEVISAIQKMCVTSDDKPIPTYRIESALKAIHAHIDIDGDASRQAESFYEKLTEVIPIKRAKTDMEAIITVPLALSGAASTIIRRHCTVQREIYHDRAKYEVEVLECDMLLKDLAKATNGDYEFNIVGQDQHGNAPAHASGSGGK